MRGRYRKALNISEEGLLKLLLPDGAPSADAFQFDAAVFKKCVASAAGQELADSVIVDDKGLGFKEGFNPATLSQAQIAAVMKCGEEQGIAGTAPGGAQPPAGGLPGNIPQLPGGALPPGSLQPPSTAAGAADAFRQCVTQSLGPVIGTAVGITGGSLTFGQGLDPSKLTPQQTSAILACAQKFAAAAAPPGAGPSAGAIPQPPAGALPQPPSGITPQPPAGGAPSQPSAQAPPAGQQAAFTQCVASLAGAEVAAAVKIVDGNITFGEGIDPSKLPPQLTTAVLFCAQQTLASAGAGAGGSPFPPVGQAPVGQAPAGQTPPSGFPPLAVPTLPPVGQAPPLPFPTAPVTQAPASDPKHAEFQKCVAGVIGAQQAAAVSIQNGQLTFGPGLNPATLGPNLEGIQACADKSGLLVLGSGPSAGQSDMPQIAARTPAEQEFWDCLKGTHRADSVPGFRLTQGGLPDFSISGAFPLSANDFQVVIDCVPGLGSNLPLQHLPADVRAKAQAAADKATNSVVAIESAEGALGSGFFISKDGLVMTNNHVVSGMTGLVVWLRDGRKFPAQVVGKVVTPDIAVLKIDAPADIQPLPIGSTANLKVGDALIAIGHPGGFGNWLATAGQFLELNKTTFTPVKSLDPEQRQQVIVDLVSTVPGSAGSSGGPLIDLDGKVVGVAYGGTQRLPPRPNGAPIPGSRKIRERTVTSQISQAVPIEEAMLVAANVPGGASLKPASGSIASQTKPELTPAARTCVSGVLGTQSALFKLTDGGGLPDFSGFGSTSLTPSQFRSVVGCIPGLVLIPSPETLVDAELKPFFPEDVRAKATAAADKVRASVVFLDLSKEATASGFVISKDGLILTNNHNIEGKNGENVIVWLVGGRSFPAKVLASIKQPDIALLKIDAPPDLMPVTIGSSLSLQPDQPLIVVGNPGGIGNWIASLGKFVKVSPAIDTTGNPVREFAATTPSMKGSSGSPVLNLDGQVVGVIWGGEDPEGKRGAGEPPKPSSSAILEYLVARDHALAVGIEEAMKLVKGWTGQ
ncbi:MAG: trypsin-like peptidase domain-containing protein [Chloroflexi bacterium]|nr:trypsin-like peptidase domain-containing protein [Chloroflexota bacterium]